MGIGAKRAALEADPTPLVVVQSYIRGQLGWGQAGARVVLRAGQAPRRGPGLWGQGPRAPRLWEFVAATPLPPLPPAVISG